MTLYAYCMNRPQSYTLKFATQTTIHICIYWGTNSYSQIRIYEVVTHIIHHHSHFYAFINDNIMYIIIYSFSIVPYTYVFPSSDTTSFALWDMGYGIWTTNMASSCVYVHSMGEIQICSENT